jgi:hypothetical protein
MQFEFNTSNLGTNTTLKPTSMLIYCFGIVILSHCYWLSVLTGYYLGSLLLLIDPNTLLFGYASLNLTFCQYWF